MSKSNKSHAYEQAEERIPEEYEFAYSAGIYDSDDDVTTQEQTSSSSNDTLSSTPFVSGNTATTNSESIPIVSGNLATKSAVDSDNQPPRSWQIQLQQVC
jgi:hypothetical protein